MDIRIHPRRSKAPTDNVEQIVEVLLERSSQHHIHEAVLQAISAGHIQIAETILKHKRYLEMWKERRKLGDTDGFYKTAYAESQFSPDITPLILAAQKNQYEIVQLLLLRGETIQKPHKFSCGCQECRNKMKFDQLRLAKYRLNAFRGLASEAYISLSSKDPILTAFELGAELKRLSRVEKHFKREYRDLAEQLSDYTVKCLDRVRTQKELEIVLNKAGKPASEKYESLARFKLALKFKEKKARLSVTVCQQRVVRTWYNGMGKLQRAAWPQRFCMAFMFVITYPLLVFLHLIAPGAKPSKTLQLPVIKFLCHATSFLAFLVLIVLVTVESSAGVSKDKTLANNYGDAFKNYQILYNRARAEEGGEPNVLGGPDFPVRANTPTITEIMMSLWILGMIFQECNQIFTAGVEEHLMNLYNLLDFLLLSVYSSVFTIHRMKWQKWDPINLSEGMFAMANILSFSRISYLLPANEYLGPLQISLGRMLKDIMKFMALFTLVILAFMVGLHNLFWYYSERKNIELSYEGKFVADGVRAEDSFGGVLATFRTVFWSLFGRGEPDAVKLGDYNNNLTEDIGYIIYGLYNIVMVTVLINMLIAMMTRSFTNIAEDSDVEWKFARSLLYMEYISEGGTLPPPMNVIGAPKAIFRALFCSCNSPPSSLGSSNGPGPSGQTPLAPIASLNLDGESGQSANPVDADISAVEIYEGNAARSSASRAASVDSPRHVLVPLESSEEELTYQKTMQRIIQRYIFDIQREAEVTEDDFEEIKQDILSFRFEMMNQWKTKEAMHDEMAANVKHILDMMSDAPATGSSTGTGKEGKQGTSGTGSVSRSGSKRGTLESDDSISEEHDN
ncbi:hypothetical protein BaRGS_00002926 [Batillaria attramentaria]|uniref:Transient receptor ion channel domain-containing protein n=1 Tax=Batillaria attramentaria TaxID=370345 RepID=A0ABD0M156_9CAEN